MLFPLLYAIYYQETVINAFILSMAITSLSGLLLWKYFSSKEPIGHKEGFAIAALGWIFVAGFGALPFLFAGTFPSFIDAYFESMSGFTTTGATVLVPINSFLARLYPMVGRHGNYSFGSSYPSGLRSRRNAII
jgi:trk system potassium uptake protein TrkH